MGLARTGHHERHQRTAEQQPATAADQPHRHTQRSHCHPASSRRRSRTLSALLHAASRLVALKEIGRWRRRSRHLFGNQAQVARLVEREHHDVVIHPGAQPADATGGRVATLHALHLQPARRLFGQRHPRRDRRRIGPDFVADCRARGRPLHFDCGLATHRPEGGRRGRTA